jgi:ribosome-binding ATPase YchF (GTP1/OBG family)
MEIGIVGLPNVGKSTLFNALLKKQVAYVANFPFATIEPNVGVVPVPDGRLGRLSEVVKESEKLDFFPPEVPAAVKFVDIAGLVKGASEGAGLGNRFLSHIREVDAICHVLRVFCDENIIREGAVDPKSDFEIVKTELDLADLEMSERHEKKKKTDEPELPLLSKKPILVVLNVDEKDLKVAPELEKKYAVELNLDKEAVIAVCAKTEAEIADLGEEDQKTYLKESGIEESGLEKLVKRAFEILGLQTFLTAGEIETRAWTIKKGTRAPAAAGVIHTDFEKHFIKADCVNYEDFVTTGGWVRAREAGKVRQEGREYVMREGDVVEFKVGV